jgi:phosphoribosyl 1,2-cyclic phosphate phosphodiesterase
MDDIRSYNFVQNSDIPIYARSQVMDQLKREFAYIFEGSKYPGVPRVKVQIIENQPFEIQGQNIIPIEVMHLKLPVFGFRIGDFTYITDAKTIAEPEKQKIKGSKVLVLNALQKTEHYSHLNLDEAIALAEELGAEKTYFTHISHKMGCHEDVAKSLPDHIKLAYDGQMIEL